MNKNAVILFTNSPYVEAKRKTPSSNPAIFLLAKECFEESILHLANKISSNNYSLLVSSSDKSLFTYLNVDKGKTILQSGNSFGERFYNSINEAFKKGFEKIAIVGNDTTVIKKGELSKSLKIADSDKVCVGSSTNGGFYLLSISKTSFQKIQKHKFISLAYKTEKTYSDLIKLLKSYLFKIKSFNKKNYFDCSNELLVVHQLKKMRLLIRFELTKNIFSLLSNNFIRNIFDVTHSLDYQLSFHKAPPLG